MLDTAASSSKTASIGTTKGIVPSTPAGESLHSVVVEQPLSPSRSKDEAAATPASFFMDWLERINMDHLDFGRKLLKTPDRGNGGKQNEGQLPADDQRQEESNELNGSVSSETSSPEESPQRSTSSVRPLNLSPAISFRQRSICIGNGWNAKGLEKAQLGLWEHALACWENALEIRQQVLGLTHPDVANTWNNMGIALGKLNQVSRALEALDTALNIRIQNYGGTEKHTEVAATYHNLANVHQQAGNYAAALKYLRKSLAIVLSLLGPQEKKQDLQVARTLMAIGHVHYDAKDYREALRMYRKACSIMQLCSRAHHECGGVDCSGEIEQCQQDIVETEALWNHQQNKRASDE